MPDEPTLDEYVASEGTTDNPREGTVLDAPDDGHVHHEDTVHDYWHGDERIGYQDFPTYTLVPPGSFSIVLSSDDAVEAPHVDEPSLRPGVYLKGTATLGMRPPPPTAIDDTYLRFAAEAAVLAVAEVASDEAVVAIQQLHHSLSFGVRSRDRGVQDHVYNPHETPITYLEHDPRPGGLHGGYICVRRFGTPFDVHTRVPEPRLDLDDLRVPVPWTGGDC